MSILTATAAALLVAGEVAEPLPVSTSVPPSDDSHLTDGQAIVVEAPLLYPSVGLMNDHMHNGGEFMIGLRFERNRWSGTNVTGTQEIADEDIVAAGYSTRTKSMTMDMAMLDLMYAPTGDITLMLMPHYMWHRMAMVGIDPRGGEHGGGHGGHGGHSMPFGEVMEYSAKGFGDTLASASFRLARHRRFNAHMTLGVWLPTGKSDLKNPDGTFVHYGMQPGSGTWDVEPSVTVSGKQSRVGWGAQAAYKWRVSEFNDSGFRFGDKARVSGWLSYVFRPTLGATARLEYLHEGAIEGHYNAAHNHSAPADRQANYGGKTISGALGFNWQPPLRGFFRPELGVEVSVPIHQKLNGIQPPQDWRLSTAIRQTF